MELRLTSQLSPSRAARAGAPDIEEIKARWRASGRTPSLIDDRDEYALTNCPTHKESA